MQRFSNYLLPALLVGFFLFGLSAFLQSKPQHKNTRIYKAVQRYSPYYFEKRFGGLEILSKTDPNFKQKPSNMAVFETMAQLERAWAQKHLVIQDDTLLIRDTHSIVDQIPIKTSDERHFIEHYYGIK